MGFLGLKRAVTKVNWMWWSLRERQRIDKIANKMMLNIK